MTSPDHEVSPVQSPISKVELVALLAMLTATVAFSIDAMLPALPAIGAEISPVDPNKAQLVIAAFVFGMGFGTLFTGPLSDAYGRLPVATGGAAVYVASAVFAATTQDLEALLIARALQGIGAAGPRIVAVAIVRDLFSGRQMAQIVSFIMIVFTLVPVLAPTMGAIILWNFGWRSIFLSFGVFSLISVMWLLLRQPETLPPSARRPFRTATILQGVREVLQHRQVVIAILVQTLIFAVLFSVLMTSQAIFDVVLGSAETFPFWFGLVAAISASGSLLNATIVVQLGMRTVVKWALIMQLSASSIVLLLLVSGALDGAALFPVTIAWLVSIFYLAGLGIGNMNAIAMEPLGHIAGLASSIISAAATIFSSLIAVPIGQAFNGTLEPLLTGVFLLCALALVLLLEIRDSN